MGEGRVYGAEVRLMYATIINFLAEFLSYIASFMFVVLIARRLSVEEFGTWTLIMRYVSYLVMAAIIYTYWARRTISRGFNTSKTAVVMSIELGLLASVIYLFIGYGSSAFFSQPLPPLLLASLIVLTEFINQGQISIASAHSPQYVGIARAVLRFLMVALAVVTVPLLSMGLMGVVIAAVGARVGVLAMLLYVNRGVIAESKYRRDVEVKWLKTSWLTLLTSVSGLLYTLDAVIARAASGSDELIAYYGIAISIYGLTIGTTRALPTLYARLLARRDIRDAIEILWIVFLINLPLLIGILLYADALAYLYNPKYAEVADAIRIFSLASLFSLLARVLATVVTGLEERDADHMWESSKLLKTTLFYIPAYTLAASAIYLGAVGGVTYSVREPINALGIWGILFLTYSASLAIGYDWILRREYGIKLPYREVGKYLLRFLVASIPMILIRAVWPVELSPHIWPLLTSFLPPVVLSMALYFTVLYALDPKFRDLTARFLKKMHSS